MEGRHLADWLKNSLSMDKMTRFEDKKYFWLYGKGTFCLD
jgi:hypothetical protein